MITIVIDISFMEPELDFDAILRGEDPTPKNQPEKTNVKVSETDTRKRQQSCQVKDVDKDLVVLTLYSFLQPTIHLIVQDLEYLFPIC